MSAAYKLMIMSRSRLFSSLLSVLTLIYLVCTVLSASPSLHPDEGLVVLLHYIFAKTKWLVFMNLSLTLLCF